MGCGRNLPAMIADRHILGISFILGFCALAPLGDAAAKYIALTTPLIMVVFARYVTQWLLPLPIIFATKRNLRMSREVFIVIVLRTAAHAIAVATMIASYRFLPLADALAIAFVFPFIMLKLGHAFLDEPVGPRRFAACLAGFLGTLLIIQPSFAAVGLPALLPLVTAVLFAAMMLLTRQIAKKIDPVSMQVTTGFVGVVIIVVVFALASPLGIFDISLIVPDAVQWTALAIVGVMGTLSHLSLAYAVRYAPATVLAPMQYIELPAATFVGWMVFREFPNGLAAVGICITIAAGLAVIFFERKAHIRAMA